MTKTVVTKKKMINLITGTAVALALILGARVVNAADCTSDGAYGETCVYDKDFEVEKKVRKLGDSDWEDKIVDVPEGKIIQFRVRVKNVGNTDVSNMKMEDILPDEIERTGGADLTEYWSDFDEGETKEFIIEARIKSKEFDRTDNFEKCVVNKAKAYHGDDLVGSDTATVCYGEGEITELPKAGPTAVELMSILGFVSTGTGIFLKRFSRLS